MGCTVLITKNASTTASKFSKQGFNWTRLNYLQQSPALTIKMWAYGKGQSVEGQQCIDKSFTDATKQDYPTM